MAILVPLAAFPCRYSVRDTGFVDLEQPPWRLRVSGLGRGPAEAWHKAATGHLFDANIQLEIADPRPATPVQLSGERARGSEPLRPTAPAPVTGAGEIPGLFSLIGFDDRVLPLVAPKGHPAEQPADIAEFLDRIALSRTRDQLHAELLRTFAVFLFIEGTDSRSTTAARDAATAAIRAFTPRLRSLPKPVDTPPVIVSIPAADIDAERVLVWSVGCEPRPQSDPRLVVLFGRGRRLGEPIEGALITRTLLEERLTLIGQDCECDLDRRWLQGTVFPGRWDTARQTEAARRLGFDPESPMVRTEVSRIVLRGPIAGQDRGSSSEPRPSLAFGYREESVDAKTEADSETNSTNANPPPEPVHSKTSPGIPEPTALPRWPWITLIAFLFATLTAGSLILAKKLRTR